MEQNTNRDKEVFDIVKGVLDAAHELQRTRVEAAPMQAALSSNDRDRMISAIHKGASENESFINSTSCITGRWVVRISGFYDDKSIEYIRHDVEFCITIVYLKMAIKLGLTQVLRRALKKKLGIDDLILDGMTWVV